MIPTRQPLPAAVVAEGHGVLRATSASSLVSRGVAGLGRRCPAEGDPGLCPPWARRSCGSASCPAAGDRALVQRLPGALALVRGEASDMLVQSHDIAWSEVFSAKLWWVRRFVCWIITGIFRKIQHC